MPIVLDVKDPDFATWTRLYRPSGNGIPMLFIVSPKGDEFANVSGAPQGDGLQRLLLSGIEKNGGPKDLSKLFGSGKDEKKLAATLRNARLLLGKKQTAEAIALLVSESERQKTPEESSEKPAGKLADLAAKAKPEPVPERTGPAKDIEELLGKLLEDGRAAFSKAQGNLANDSAEKQLLGAVGLVETRRIYSALPELREAIETEVEAQRKNAEQAKLLEHAELIDVARAWEAKDNTRAAIAAYRKVVAAFPESTAATLSQRRIDQLSGAAADTAPASEKPAGIASGDSAADLKKAAAMLKMAKTFSATRAEKAKEYAAQVIELAPKSAEAAEARALIERLK